MSLVGLVVWEGFCLVGVFLGGRGDFASPAPFAFPIFSIILLESGGNEQVAGWELTC